MLHSKKSQSILQWFNSLTTKGDVNSLEQFTDGSHFYEIVASVQPFLVQGRKEGHLAAESVIFSETGIACVEEVITSVEEEAAEGKNETPVSENVSADPFVVKESDHTDTQKKYDVIKKFIDDFYHVESSFLIDYGECQKGKELELAKVAVFLLSAMVQNLLSSEDKVVYNTTLLEPEVQENIRECLSLVLDEKDAGENQIKKSELHKILSRAANYKGTPLRKQPSRSTPDPNDLSDGVKNLAKKRKERTSVIVYEDNQDSPLKHLLESPKIQYKACMFKKESELAKLRSALHSEENKVMDLTLEKQNLNDELEKRKKELEFYKKELNSQREAFSEKEEQEMVKVNELKEKKIEEERVKKLIESKEEEIKQLKENNEALQEKVVDIEKKLEQHVASSLIKENNNLKDKIQILELGNEEKAETIKVLNEKITSLENDLKTYHQMFQDSSAPNSRKELTGSPNVPETAKTIIYADKQSSRASLERKEQELRQDLETKDERIKRLAHKGETSKNANVESLQIMVDQLHGNVSTLEREKNTLKQRLEFYESKFGPTSDISSFRDLNSFKNEKILSADDVSEPCLTKPDNKMKDQLLANGSNNIQPPKTGLLFLTPELEMGKFAFDKLQLKQLLTQLEKKNCIGPTSIKRLRENCIKMTKPDELSACLRDFVQAFKLPPETSVTTRSSRLDANSLIDKNKNLEQENHMLKQNLKSLRNKSTENDELKTAINNLKESEAGLKNEIENLKEKLEVSEDKYKNLESISKQKNLDVRRALYMYKRIKGLTGSEGFCGQECKKLKLRCKELNEECLDFEHETAELKRSIKNLEGTIENLQFEIKRLSKEKEQLQHKLWEETSAFSKNTADRDALVLHYLKKSKLEPKNKGLEVEKEQMKSSRPIVRVDAYILNSDNEPSTSNSVLGSRSVRSSCFQAADEDDFLNESSLAEIHSLGIPEEESSESRLLEIRRRNTLCPPHLQSSYPLEIQNMTPSEKKYYHPGEVSFDLSRKISQYSGKRDIRKNLKSKYIESDGDDSDDSLSFPVKKRKTTATDRITVPVSKRQTGHVTVPVSKKQSQPSYNVARGRSKDQDNSRKPSTPLKRMAAFVKRQATFKTPLSVHRLIERPKIH